MKMAKGPSILHLLPLPKNPATMEMSLCSYFLKKVLVLPRSLTIADFTSWFLSV